MPAKKHIGYFNILICVMILLATAPAAAQQQLLFEGRSMLSTPSAHYKNLLAENFRILSKATLPGSCQPGEIINVNGSLQMCFNNNWNFISDAWNLRPTYLYLGDTTATLGIGWTTPYSTNPKLNVTKKNVTTATDASVAVDIDHPDAPLGGRWRMASYNNVRLLPSGSLQQPFLIDNFSSPLLTSNAFLITQSGSVNIAESIPLLPALISSLLNIQNNTNNALTATTPRKINQDNLTAAFSLTGSINNGMGTGIGFGIHENAPNEIHGAIAAERVATGGKLHLAARNPSGINIGITIHPNGKVSLSSPGSTAPGHLVLNRRIGDPLGAATIIFKNTDATIPPTIGTINFKGPVESFIKGQQNGDIVFNQNGRNTAIFTTEPRGEVKIFKAGGEEDGFLKTSPGSSKTIRGRVNALGAIVSGSGGFLVGHPSFGSDYIVTFSSPFRDTPAVIINSVGQHFYTLSSLSPTGFRVNFTSPGPPIAQLNSAFSFIAIGKR